MQFKDIEGQRDIINRLTQTIDNGRVSHAQLIVGNNHDGGVAMALAYLQYLCCDHREHYAEATGQELRADSCGTCPNCKKIASMMHPDLHFIFPNAATNRVDKDPESQDFMTEFRAFVERTHGGGSLDEWFAALEIEKKMAMINVRDANTAIRLLELKAYEGGWKMLVVWMPEKMNAEAANKLLKTLEEPTPKTLIMMVGENDEALLPTIRSRVQTIRLHPSPRQRSADEKETYAPMMVGWLRMLFKLKMKDLAEQVEKMASLNREQLKLMLQFVLTTMQECFLSTVADMPCNLNSGDAKFDAQFPRMVTANNIEQINAALGDAIFAVERNANAKIALMELSFRISKALKKR